MKRILSALLIMMTLFTSTVFATDNLVASNAIVERNVDVIVNGEKLILDVSPVILNDRTMVPVRAIAEALQADVQWDPATGAVTVTQNEGMSSAGTN